jgi:TonB family protein
MSEPGSPRLSDNPRMPRVGQAVGGRYQIERVLGEGGFGAVYLAVDRLAGGRVALKVLEPEKSDQPQFADRFRQEVMVVRTLTHHNTIKIWDVGQTETGCLFMAMELVEGEPLSAVVARDGALAPERVRRISRQTLLALSEAHGKGIVHRDLKPDNIMLRQLPGEPDFVKVLDFGIAKAFGELSMVKTQTGFVMCTAAYAAPELLKAKGVGPATDIYAFGLIVLEMLTGRQAVAGDSIAELIAQQMAPEPVPLPPSLRGTPLGGWVERAIAKDRALRYPDANAMLEALSALPLTAFNLRAADPVGPPADAAPSRQLAPPQAVTAAHDAETAPRSGGLRALILAATGVLAVTAAVVATLLAPGGEGDPSSEPAALAGPSQPPAPASDERSGPAEPEARPEPVTSADATLHQRLRAHVARLEGGTARAEAYEVQLVEGLDLQELSLARVVDTERPDAPPHDCAVVSGELFCRGQGLGSRAFFASLGLIANRDRLDDAQWTALAAFLMGAQPSAVARAPAAPATRPPLLLYLSLPLEPAVGLSHALLTETAWAALEWLGDDDLFTLLLTEGAEPVLVYGPAVATEESFAARLIALPLGSAPLGAPEVAVVDASTALTVGRRHGILIAGAGALEAPIPSTHLTASVAVLPGAQAEEAVRIAFENDGRIYLLEDATALPAAVRQEVRRATGRPTPVAPPRVRHAPDVGTLVSFWARADEGWRHYALHLDPQGELSHAVGPPLTPEAPDALDALVPRPTLIAGAWVTGRLSEEDEPAGEAGVADHLALSLERSAEVRLDVEAERFHPRLTVLRDEEVVAEGAADGRHLRLEPELPAGDYVVVVSGGLGTYRVGFVAGRDVEVSVDDTAAQRTRREAREERRRGETERAVLEPVVPQPAAPAVLDRNAIQRVVGQHRGQIRRCYEAELAHDASLEGRVDLRFVIGLTGSVQSVTITNSTLGNDRVEGCVLDAVRGWAFPPPDDGIMSVNYPFVFSPQ